MRPIRAAAAPRCMPVPAAPPTPLVPAEPVAPVPGPAGTPGSGGPDCAGTVSLAAPLAGSLSASATDAAGIRRGVAFPGGSERFTSPRSAGLVSWVTGLVTALAGWTAVRPATPPTACTTGPRHTADRLHHRPRHTADRLHHRPRHTADRLHHRPRHTADRLHHRPRHTADRLHHRPRHTADRLHHRPRHTADRLHHRPRHTARCCTDRGHCASHASYCVADRRRGPARRRNSRCQRAECSGPRVGPPGSGGGKLTWRGRNCRRRMSANAGNCR